MKRNSHYRINPLQINDGEFICQIKETWSFGAHTYFVRDKIAEEDPSRAPKIFKTYTEAYSAGQRFINL